MTAVNLLAQARFLRHQGLKLLLQALAMCGLHVGPLKLAQETLLLGDDFLFAGDEAGFVHNWSYWGLGYWVLGYWVLGCSCCILQNRMAVYRTDYFQSARHLLQ